MNVNDLRERGLVLLGCGKMGSAMLEGWLKGALEPRDVWVIDPQPSDWLRSIDGLNLNADLPERPALVLVAVKPQMMEDALPQVKTLGGGGTVFLSVAAGTTIERYERMLGDGTPVIRAMPNTPAAIGRGITALAANAEGAPALDLAETLLSAVGQTVRLETEDQMDAVTGVSGSGPAYVFHLIDCLAKAGEAEGLPPELAMRLAKATVGGAGQLAENSPKSPEELRRDVTSPGGTTKAGLDVLMDMETGLPPLIRKTVAAAAARARELGR
ncbi:pyrroline-5-carboxylate reductase [Palleronia aestuarii]|uniref:Pyrroline-5-carboxylate reductase n=1 Tax=Palleronia aestuarii TaxID=568105 RepID=A0A2W7NGR1_9RHOB|nr:pyrroline-5-carboxylate reductase [Palleronia aestuarii]PZX19601.1 pyrroline-5-carboxylate reductase [Palleronia aestuarii]